MDEVLARRAAGTEVVVSEAARCAGTFEPQGRFRVLDASAALDYQRYMTLDRTTSFLASLAISSRERSDASSTSSSGRGWPPS
jgi:hypothetical protein